MSKHKLSETANQLELEEELLGAGVEECQRKRAKKSAAHIQRKELAESPDLEGRKVIGGDWIQDGFVLTITSESPKPVVELQVRDPDAANFKFVDKLSYDDPVDIFQWCGDNLHGAAAEINAYYAAHPNPVILDNIELQIPTSAEDLEQFFITLLMNLAIPGQGKNQGNCMITEIDHFQSSHILAAMSNVDVRYNELTKLISDQHLPLAYRWVIADTTSDRGLMVARRDQMLGPGGAYRAVFL